jgi:oligopeptide transport system ATP-binding protein
MEQPLLQVSHVKMHFPGKEHFFSFSAPKEPPVRALDGVSFSLKKGETLGIVGESGCGKSTLGRTILRLYEPTEGRIVLEGKDITHLKGEALRKTRTSYQMIFQDPYASLNPRMNVFELLSEPLVTHGLARGDLTRRVAELMEQVGLSRRFIQKYPHEFSGGQRQRIAIARAIAIKPKLVICDEPVSALDVSIQAQILNLLTDLQEELGLSYIFIAHDMGAVRHMAHRIGVMYLGRIVEIGETEEIFSNPRHPYTQALLSAVPLADPDKERARKRIILSGDLPSPSMVRKGCSFESRCQVRLSQCTQDDPYLESSKHTPERLVACLRETHGSVPTPGPQN